MSPRAFIFCVVCEPTIESRYLANDPRVDGAAVWSTHQADAFDFAFEEADRMTHGDHAEPALRDVRAHVCVREGRVPEPAPCAPRILLSRRQKKPVKAEAAPRMVSPAVRSPVSWMDAYAAWEAKHDA